ncbi:MAG: hypothetical protein R3A80_10855 [Bdellovibrionota bacterium]
MTSFFKNKYFITLLSLLLLGGGFFILKPFEKPIEKNFSIFFTGNVLGRVRSCGCSLKDYGGIYRRANFVDQEKQLRTSLWLDYGNYFVDPETKESMDYQLKKRDLLAGLTHELNYDVMGLGLSDNDSLSELLKYNLPFVSLGAESEILPYKVLEKGAQRFAVTAVQQYDENLVEKIETWIGSLEQPVIPVVLSTLSMENSALIAERLSSPVLIVGHTGMLETILAIERGSSVFVTGTEMGRQIGTAELKAIFKGSRLVSLKLVSSDYIPANSIYDEGEAGNKMLEKIQAWEKINGEISEI